MVRVVAGCTGEEEGGEGELSYARMRRLSRTRERSRVEQVAGSVHTPARTHARPRCLREFSPSSGVRSSSSSYGVR